MTRSSPVLAIPYAEWRANWTSTTCKPTPDDLQSNSGLIIFASNNCADKLRIFCAHNKLLWPNGQSRKPYPRSATHQSPAHWYSQIPIVKSRTNDRHVIN